MMQKKALKTQKDTWSTWQSNASVYSLYIYGNIYIKFSRAMHFQPAHYGDGILAMAFWECAFSGCHSQDVHSENAILRMRIRIIYFQFIYMLVLKRHFVFVICHVLRNTLVDFLV